MSSSKIISDFWLKHWNEDVFLDSNNLQAQVCRTSNKEPLSSDIWHNTVLEIIKLIDLTDNDEVVDLCAGNGLVAIPLAERCKHVTAVDISTKLLEKIDTVTYPNIKKLEKDLRETQFDNNSFSKAIIYSSIQYFTDRETILLVKSIYNWLKPGGLLYLGDVPDFEKIFFYYNNAERQKNYFQSIINEEPIIGTWFAKSFFESLSSFIGFKNIKIIEQPSFQINSHYRYDVLFEK